MRSIDQLKSELQIAKSNHSQDVDNLQQEMAILKEDFSRTKSDLSMTQDQNLDQKTFINNLSEELEKLKKIHEEDVLDVSGTVFCFTEIEFCMKLSNRSINMLSPNSVTGM